MSAAKLVAKAVVSVTDDLLEMLARRGGRKLFQTNKDSFAKLAGWRHKFHRATQMLAGDEKKEAIKDRSVEMMDYLNREIRFSRGRGAMAAKSLRSGFTGKKGREYIDFLKGKRRTQKEMKRYLEAKRGDPKSIREPTQLRFSKGRSGGSLKGYLEQPEVTYTGSKDPESDVGIILHELGHILKKRKQNYSKILWDEDPLSDISKFIPYRPHGSPTAATIASSVTLPKEATKGIDPRALRSILEEKGRWRQEAGKGGRSADKFFEAMGFPHSDEERFADLVSILGSVHGRYRLPKAARKKLRELFPEAFPVE